MTLDLKIQEGGTIGNYLLAFRTILKVPQGAFFSTRSKTRSYLLFPYFTKDNARRLSYKN